MPGGKARGKKQPASKSRPVSEPPAQGGEQQESFQRELAWCIQQLELGLSLQTSKCSSAQSQEAVRILKILKNPKAALVKKRQAMHSTFGDYRHKMSEDAKKFSAKAKQVNFKSQKLDDQPKFTFFKKRNSPDDAEQVLESDQVCELPGTSRSTDTDRQDFKFNFSVETKDELDGAAEQAISTKQQVADCEETIMDISKNYFKMETSNTEFTFNFDVSDKT